jgi:hypothetical protein
VTSVDDYAGLIAAVMRFEPPVHVFGGFAEDAVLYGGVHRPHEDLDVLVGRHALTRQLENARDIGFAPFEVRFEAIPGRPLVLGATSGDLDLEVSAYDLTPEGTVLFTLPDADGALRQVHLSGGVFDHPPAMLDGVPLRTVSPLALYQIRAGLTMLGTFGSPRPKDIVSQDALRERFFPEASTERLAPAII